MPLTTVEPTPLGSSTVCQCEVGPIGLVSTNPCSTPDPSRYDPTIWFLLLIPNAWVSDPPGKPNAIVEVPIFSHDVVLPAASVAKPTTSPALLIPVATTDAPGT